MAREKGMGNLQLEKSGRWTMRVGIKGKRYCRSTRTTDREKAERIISARSGAADAAVAAAEEAANWAGEEMGLLGVEETTSRIEKFINIK